jgi:hypothetical protein
VVRGTTRRPERCAEIEAAGAEAVVADPDRVATLAPALAGVAVVCVLLGSASGSAEQLAALHGPRLEMLLSRILDTPVRGFVYEQAAGAELVSATCGRSRIPYAVVPDAAAPAVLADAIERVLLGAPSE